METATNPANLSADVLRAAALEAAWDKALMSFPALALLSVTRNSLLDVMSDAVDRALAMGIVDPETLTQEALEAVPKLRRPKGK